MSHSNRGSVRLHGPTAAVLGLVLLALATARPSARADAPGILLMAHGGRQTWNEHVMQLASRLDTRVPVEVAFGMASRQSIQAAIDRLAARQVTRIVAVPLFISTYSSVITSTEYLLGLRPSAPPELAAFARMSHGHGGHGHTAHASDTADGTTPVNTMLPIRMTPALDSHAIVGDILIDRARALSRSPGSEAVVLVAHGPVPDDDNRRWLGEMSVLAARVRESARFAAVDYLTVRDDAPAPVKAAATEELRQLIARRSAEGRRVLVVPLLLSFGGIEEGIRKRLEGLEYAMSAQGLMPDDRIADWVMRSAGLAQP